MNCGFAAGLAMGVALYRKHRTGETARARTSLAAVTNLAQVPFAFDYEGRAPFDEPSGREALGNHELSHFYPTADGWLFIDSQPSELARLDQVEGLKGIAQAGNIRAFLTEALARAPSSYWLDVLRQADVAVAEPVAIETLRQMYSREADGTPGTDLGSFAFSIYPDHPSGHCITQVDHYAIRPAEARIRAFRPTERFGHSTREILASVGYSEHEIDVMIEQGVAGLGWGKEFLPS